ncbi:hypothetical protein [Candidatus Poriferisocius sp.]|uniref:hypothetical protein n=1 Tax=Candidatus Poriferisocius sp. TaxID=3101276 RepID=UPI003B020912
MSTSAAQPIIIGSYNDPHVQDVADRLDNPIVLDVETLQKGDIAVVAGELIGITNHEANLSRGWIRRLAPAGWTHGIQANSRQAMEQAAWLSMLISFIRTSSAKWLTEIDRLVSAENKMLLSQVAAEMGIKSPKSAIACSPQHAVNILGTRNIVAKPIGPSNFLMGQDHVSIPTSSLTSWLDTTFLPEPYLYQERIQAARHFRVVTVGDHSWCYTKEVVDGDPIDWRYSPTGHDGFVSFEDKDIRSASLALANKLNIGYSSQDWIDDGDTKWVIDMNPSGQWLFLQDSQWVGTAIATWLLGTSRDL